LQPRRLGAREHPGDAQRSPRVVEIDADEARVGVDAAHEGDVDQARQRQVVHVAAAPREQAWVVTAFDARPDVYRRASAGTAGI